VIDELAKNAGPLDHPARAMTFRLSDSANRPAAKAPTKPEFAQTRRHLLHRRSGRRQITFRFGCTATIRFSIPRLSPTAIVELAKQVMACPAVALTDTGNLHGAVEFVQAAKKAGIKADPGR
jgi:hypothetical protein